MASQGNRSGNLYAVIERLKAEGPLDEGEIVKAAGGAIEAEEMIRLLLDLRLVERKGGIITATKLIGGQLTAQQLGNVEEYVLGAKEAHDFRRLMDSLGREPAGIDVDSPGAGSTHTAEKKVEVDPEVVKRYAKDFLDVSEIAARQKQPKKVGK